MQVEAQEAMREALELCRNVLFLLADEVDALGLGAYRVREKVAEALSLNPPLSLDAGAEPKWPPGYCLDPNGRMIAPEGKGEDFDFGYEIGYGEAFATLKRASFAAQPSIDKPAEPKKRGYLGSTVDGGFDDHGEEPAEPSALTDVVAERERQKTVEGWTPEHDDDHHCCELAMAAACYAAGTDGLEVANGAEVWPWAPEWWKPSDQRRNLVKAGALILAEIERLDRKATP